MFIYRYSQHPPLMGCQKSAVSCLTEFLHHVNDVSWGHSLCNEGVKIGSILHSVCPKDRMIAAWNPVLLSLVCPVHTVLFKKLCSSRRVLWMTALSRANENLSATKYFVFRSNYYKFTFVPLKE